MRSHTSKHLPWLDRPGELSDLEKANRLLLTVLPKEIAPIIKENDHTIADYYPEASVLFADIVGSTPLFARLEPAEAADWLNEVL